jgi:hypothetical protein
MGATTDPRRPRLAAEPTPVDRNAGGNASAAAMYGTVAAAVVEKRAERRQTVPRKLSTPSSAQPIHAAAALCMMRAGEVVTCACGMRMWHVHVACAWGMCMGHVHVACAWGMCMGHVHGACAWGMCMGHVHGACAWGMYMGHVHGACAWGMCMGHVHGACAWG